MRLDILTIFPEMFTGILTNSILKRAQDKGLAEINLVNIRDYATDRHKRVDDYQYGGGPGMVMLAEPIVNCIEDLQKKVKYDEIVFLTPDGDIFNQKMANRLSVSRNIILLCGHYKGVDERVRENFVTLEISVGSYVLSGGELAAAVVTDSIVRLIPGVLNDETSALSDSFQDGLLSPPVYTRPFDFRGLKVPEVLLSGNDKEIVEWRIHMAIERTKHRRPDLLED
jgi:tRNA (guanine37-N1)-methyltransferase